MDTTNVAEVLHQNYSLVENIGIIASILSIIGAFISVVSFLKLKKMKKKFVKNIKTYNYVEIREHLKGIQTEFRRLLQNISKPIRGFDSESVCDSIDLKKDKCINILGLDGNDELIRTSIESIINYRAFEKEQLERMLNTINQTISQINTITINHSGE